MDHLIPVLEAVSKGELSSTINQVKVYGKSYRVHEGTSLVIVKDYEKKYLLAVGNGELFELLNGEVVLENGKVCELNHENRLIINQYFKFTAPRAFGKKTATIGLGDRLGLASAGHIQTVKGRNVKPVLAQQSIRELTLTNRTMTDMLDAAAYAVFQEGYEGGYGADGDHIKTEEDIQMALSLGVSMITLDCSDQIDNTVEGATVSELEKRFKELPQEVQTQYTEKYLNQTFEVDGLSITFGQEDVLKNSLLYHEAIRYATYIYKTYIGQANRAIDFEISIDETESITSPQAHFFVANELAENQVDFVSLAPRFCGEFQKGIDYIGDIDQFEVELSEHAQIAAHFGYKLSIHSGSDKFSVFPIIANYTKGILHVKTAGTNWLEAIRVIAQVNPELYRRMHVFALEHFEKALAYYHVTPDLESITPLEKLSDEELHKYMEDDDARQLFHVTYGLILTAETEEGKSLFRDEFYQTLHDYEDLYNESLKKHIGRHLDTLSL